MLLTEKELTSNSWNYSNSWTFFKVTNKLTTELGDYSCIFCSLSDTFYVVRDYSKE